MGMIKNAFANVSRGVVSGVTLLLMPPFLIKALSHDSYSSWMLVLQIGGYVNFFDVGLQTAVGRFTAHSIELKNTKYISMIVSTAITMLSFLSLFALAIIILVSSNLHNIFKEIPNYLYSDVKSALLLVSISLALSLPFSVFNGVLVGTQRYDILAYITSVSLVVNSLAVVVTAYLTHNIKCMATAYISVNICSFLCMFVIFRHYFKSIVVSIKSISISTAKSLLVYCYGLSVWSLAMLMVSGMDITLVGYFDYKSVPYYTIAASLTVFMIGFQNSIFTVLIPTSAVLSAREDSIQLGKLLIVTTRYCMMVLLITGLPVIIFANYILNAWVGNDYAVHATAMLQVLISANIIRLSASPYSNILIGTAQQKLVIISPLVEGLSNILCSLILVHSLGALGIALSTMVGGTVGVMSNLLYNMNRTKGITFKVSDYIWEGIATPVFCMLPFATYGLFVSFRGEAISSDSTGAFWLVVSIISTGVMLYCFSIRAEEKVLIYNIIKKISRQN
jgi:O-antigen/teichoic acid export membrane protein